MSADGQKRLLNKLLGELESKNVEAYRRSTADTKKHNFIESEDLGEKREYLKLGSLFGKSSAFSFGLISLASKCSVKKYSIFF